MQNYGMDRRVINPSLLNLDWGDVTKFPFNPDFDLGIGDFLSDLTLPTVLEDESSLSVSPSNLPDVTNGPAENP